MSGPTCSGLTRMRTYLRSNLVCNNRKIPLRFALFNYYVRHSTYGGLLGFGTRPTATPIPSLLLSYFRRACSRSKLVLSLLATHFHSERSRYNRVHIVKSLLLLLSIYSIVFKQVWFLRTHVSSLLGRRCALSYLIVSTKSNITNDACFVFSYCLTPVGR